MPHVIVKLWPGKFEEQKRRLADAITKDVMNAFDYREESVSVAMEEIPAQDWAEEVYPKLSASSSSYTKSRATQGEENDETVYYLPHALVGGRED
jgi:4-oxalocrotonate tautomerase